jgi:hypothetical protein
MRAISSPKSYTTRACPQARGAPELSKFPKVLRFGQVRP